MITEASSATRLNLREKIDPLKPTAWVSSPGLFFSNRRLRDYCRENHDWVSQGSVALSKWLTPVSGNITINHVHHHLFQGDSYYELHFVPEGSPFFKKHIPQAERRSESEEVLYQGARDLHKLLDNWNYHLGGKFTVGYTYDRLVTVAVRHLGFSPLGRLFPEKKGLSGVIILTKDLIAQRNTLRLIRDRLEPTAGRRMAERKMAKSSLIHEISNRIPLI